MSYYDLYDNRAEFSVLIGKTLVSVTKSEADDEIRFVTDAGETYLMYHDQDCCESVNVESVVGDLADLIGSPILKAEEVSDGTERPEGWQPGEYTDSYTWTFYKLATIKGYVDIRWYGESNGYYSESVSFALEGKAA